MRADFYYDSLGGGKIHACRWIPNGEIKAIVQFVHGIAEYVERYDEFAEFLNEHGILVVAEDHMGHGKSICEAAPKGCFAGGWHTAVKDTYRLLKHTMEEFSGVPYILFGHSMGSFMARTILCKYPESGIAGAVICGTGWQPAFALPLLAKVIDLMSKKSGDTAPNKVLNDLIFGSYNNKIADKRTNYDWLTRDPEIVDAYIAHPLCGFVPSGGLLRDMMSGMHYIETKENLARMRKDLPVLFIAGGEDPVGSFGKGIHQAANAFRKAGMTDVQVKIYPDCRHEILNELNKEEVFEDVTNWIQNVI